MNKITVNSEQLTVIRNVIKVFICYLLSVICCLVMAGTVFGVDREPQVAGDFYPADKKELSRVIDYNLSKYKFIENSGDLLALISPHAGYEYSGIIAAYGYKQLTKRKYDTVIVIGSAHNLFFDGISVYPSGKYITPLGDVEIDEELASKLIKYNKKIKYDQKAHQKEHSIEVQIPFLQKTLRKFKIVPVMFGNQSLENIRILSDAIVDSTDDKNVLLVASTDLSHYLSYEAANAMDSKVIKAFSEGDLVKLIDMLATKECEMCGYGPVITAMYTAERLGGNSYEVFKYLNSGNTTGNVDRVVGYMSAGIYRRPLILDEIQRNRLIQIARETLESYFEKDGEIPKFDVYDKNLLAKSGVFVTLNEHTKLRGCIGYVYAMKPLYKAVQENVINAAVRDMRFTPLTKDDLENVKIEISVLSALKRIKDPSNIKIGKHGLVIIKKRSSGLLLPQVATENGWDRNEYLENICYKAGLPPSAWKDKDSKLYVFEAQVFHEY